MFDAQPRFNAKEGRARIKEIRKFIKDHCEVVGVVNKNNHPHGYDCQTTILEMKNGDSWCSVSSEFGGRGWVLLNDGFPLTMGQVASILEGDACKQRQKRQDDDNYGRYCTLICVHGSYERTVIVQDLLTTSELRNELDELLKALMEVEQRRT